MPGSATAGKKLRALPCWVMGSERHGNFAPEADAVCTARKVGRCRKWMKVDETEWKHELDWNVDGLVQVERC